MAKRKVSLNLLQGKRVAIATEQVMISQSETGEMDQMPLVHEGIFIFSDDRDIYLNTLTDEFDTFNIVVNRNTYTMLQVVVETPKILTMEAKGSLN